MLYCELSLKIINDFEIVEHGSEQLSGFIFHRQLLVPQRREANEIHESLFRLHIVSPRVASIWLIGLRHSRDVAMAPAPNCIKTSANERKGCASKASRLVNSLFYVLSQRTEPADVVLFKKAGKKHQEALD